jgi:hypothetical protein
MARLRRERALPWAGVFYICAPSNASDVKVQDIPMRDAANFERLTA